MSEYSPRGGVELAGVELAVVVGTELLEDDAFTLVAGGGCGGTPTPLGPLQKEGEIM